jgi:hypothetical protein
VMSALGTKNCCTMAEFSGHGTRTSCSTCPPAPTGTPTTSATM